MRVPRYLKIKLLGYDKESVHFSVKILWWGWPILIAKCIRKSLCESS